MSARPLKWTSHLSRLASSGAAFHCSRGKSVPARVPQTGISTF